MIFYSYSIILCYFIPFPLLVWCHQGVTLHICHCDFCLQASQANRRVCLALDPRVLGSIVDNQVVPILCLISYNSGNHLVISISLWARGAKKLSEPPWD